MTYTFSGPSVTIALQLMKIFKDDMNQELTALITILMTFFVWFRFISMIYSGTASVMIGKTTSFVSTLLLSTTLNRMTVVRCFMEREREENLKRSQRR